MKYCPYCGAALPDGAVSFCPECGENLPNMTEEREKKHEQPATSPDTATESRKATPKKVKQKRKQKELQDQDTESSSKPDDGYDGYYDDVLPADAGTAAMALTQNGVSFGLFRWNFFQSGMRPYIAADRSS